MCYSILTYLSVFNVISLQLSDCWLKVKMLLNTEGQCVGYHLCKSRKNVRLWCPMWKEIWFMSSLVSANTIINCNCYFVSIHSHPSTQGICAFCLFHWYKFIIQAKTCSVYLWLHPTSAVGPIINHLDGPLSTFSSSEEWADIGLQRPLSSAFFFLFPDSSDPERSSLHALQILS